MQEFACSKIEDLSQELLRGTDEPGLVDLEKVTQLVRASAVSEDMEYYLCILSTTTTTWGEAGMVDANSIFSKQIQLGCHSTLTKDISVSEVRWCLREEPKVI